MDEHKIFTGLLGEKIDPRDYEFAGDITAQNLPKAKNTLRKVWYNQTEVSQNSCTLHAALGAFSDLTGYEFSLQERKDLWATALTKGASDNYGWYIVDAVNLVRDYVNTKLNLGKFVSIRVPLASDIFYTALKQGYSVVAGYNGNQEYNNDINDNGVVNEFNLTGSSTYGHAIRVVDTDTSTQNLVEVRDNYKGSTTWKNEYQIASILELYKNGVFFSSGYIFAYDIPEVKVLIDQKLTAKFENRIIFNVKTGEYAKIEGGKKIIITSLADLVNKCKDTVNKTTFACGVDENNWSKIGL